MVRKPTLMIYMCCKAKLMSNVHIPTRGPWNMHNSTHLHLSKTPTILSYLRLSIVIVTVFAYHKPLCAAATE